VKDRSIYVAGLVAGLVLGLKGPGLLELVSDWWADEGARLDYAAARTVCDEMDRRRAARRKEGL
jgi:hypothetical protein